MRFDTISPKQAEIFKFAGEPYDALICDGAVRSGKTTMMAIAFIEWAMNEFDGCNFGVCGKTVRSAERNIIMPLLGTQSVMARYSVSYMRTLSLMTIRKGNKTNYFYLFGGKDESSYMLVQGITLSGVLFDEVALMPETFVEQALARTLTEDNAKYWFNCNPENPGHWFYREWICKAEQHNAKHLHFLMTDNPANSAKALEKAKRDYPGVFYKRYVLGLWIAAEGAIYPDFDATIVDTLPTSYTDYVVSMDYGTQNATAMLLWGLKDKVWYAIKEYYYSGRDTGKPKTDDEYFDDLCVLTRDIQCSTIVIDPSAASFITLCKKRKIIAGSKQYYAHVSPADNDVLDGIRETAVAIQRGIIKVSSACKNLIEEMNGYVWDSKAKEDRPLKVRDHAADATRYFVKTMKITREKSFRLV